MYFEDKDHVNQTNKDLLAYKYINGFLCNLRVLYLPGARSSTLGPPVPERYWEHNAQASRHHLQFHFAPRVGQRDKGDRIVGKG